MNMFRFDDLFQVYGGIPYIGGLYIGMEDEVASPILKELLKSRFVHSYEYPADLIYELQITTQYFLFPNSNKIKKIMLHIPRKIDNQDVFIMRDYLSEKYYNERVDEMLQRDSKGQILGYMIDIYNEYYHFSLYSSEKNRMIVELRATKDDESIYTAFNTISKNIDLKDFIKLSIENYPKFAKDENGLDEIIPIIHGMPGFYNHRLGDEGLMCEGNGFLDEIVDDKLIGNYARDNYDIRFDLYLSDLDCLEEITFLMPVDSEGIAPTLSYLKRNFFILLGHTDIQYDFNHNPTKCVSSMSNKYVYIEVKREFFDDSFVSIFIRTIEEEHPEYYRAMYTIFDNEKLFSFFEGVDKFYLNSSDTQDAKFNPMRKKFNSFEEGLQEFIEWHKGLAHDIGGYSKDEEEIDRGRFSELWNTPGAEMPTIW